MDLEEWELLPDEGFLEINDDGGKKFYSRKFPKASTGDFHMNYFICPPEFVQKTPGPPRLLKNQLLPVPLIDLKPQDEEVVEKDMMPPSEKMKPCFSSGAVGADQDPAVSQVFFKKMKETEFVDMKVESPKSGTISASMGIIPQIEGAGVFQFEEKGDDPVVEPAEMVMKKDNNMELDLEESDDEGGLNIWKWSLTGIGAICSFGVAAATLCIIILSSHRKNKYPRRSDRKLQFQIYADDDKRMKQVVERASKINEAMTAVRGVPIARAHITFGGYYGYDAASI